VNKAESQDLRRRVIREYYRIPDLRRACLKVGYSLSSYHRISRTAKEYGLRFLVEGLYRRRVTTRRLSDIVEAAVIVYATGHPSQSPSAIARALRLVGISVSTKGVRGVFGRYRIPNHYAEQERYRRARKLDERDRPLFQVPWRPQVPLLPIAIHWPSLFQ
jgi:hypothetical protein